MVDEFQRQVAVEVPGNSATRGQCVEGYGGKEAYYPVLEALGQLCKGSEREFSRSGLGQTGVHLAGAVSRALEA